jgi:hypothetical protein
MNDAMRPAQLHGTVLSPGSDAGQDVEYRRLSAAPHEPTLVSEGRIRTFAQVQAELLMPPGANTSWVRNRAARPIDTVPIHIGTPTRSTLFHRSREGAVSSASLRAFASEVRCSNFDFVTGPQNRSTYGPVFGKNARRCRRVWDARGPVFKSRQLDH